MLISHRLQIIGIHPHRTGGTTLFSLLKGCLGADVDILSEHGNAKSSEASLLKEYKDYFIFGFVRNPWDRLLSWYFLIYGKTEIELSEHRINFEKIIELDEFVGPSDPFFHYNQLDFFTNDKGEMLANKLYRFENFSEDIKELFSSLDIPQQEIPTNNPTFKRDSRDYYTDKSIELVREKCKKDIEYFGYTFN